MPLQAYFRINAENMGQFERTLIIVDEGAYVHYVEGCTAPIYSSDSLHSRGRRDRRQGRRAVRYTTIQNWSTNVYNLVTKRAVAYEDATMEWVDGNLGSQADDEVPGDLADGRARARRGALDRLRGRRPAPGRGRQDRPRRAEHDVADHLEVDLARTAAAPATAACSRSTKGCDDCDVEGASATRSSSTRTRARTPTPTIEIDEDEVDIGHEATVSKIGEEQLFYLMWRGLPEVEAVDDDRQRLRRADRQGAADRVRGRDEPPDRAPDGRLRRLRSAAREPAPTARREHTRHATCNGSRPNS